MLNTFPKSIDFVDNVTDMCWILIQNVAMSEKRTKFIKLAEARAYVDQAMRLGRRSAPWRDLWHRLKSAASEDQAIEAIGAMRELLAEEDLLVPPGRPG